MNNLPVFAISPKHTTLDFPNGLNLDNKIEIFEARIEGWQFGIAKEMIEMKIHHRGFAILQIIFCYFEMIGKYISGYLGEDKSNFYFQKGVKATFPEIPADQELLLKSLYKNVRNGLYHIGMTKTNVVLRDDIPGSIGYNSERNLVAICPDRLVNDLDISFHNYIAKIRDPKNIELREKFELRFDHDNRIKFE